LIDSEITEGLYNLKIRKTPKIKPVSDKETKQLSAGIVIDINSLILNCLKKETAP